MLFYNVEKPSFIVSKNSFYNGRKPFYNVKKQKFGCDKTPYRPQKRLPLAKEHCETSLMFLVHPTLTQDKIELTCKVLSNVMHGIYFYSKPLLQVNSGLDLYKGTFTN